MKAIILALGLCSSLCVVAYAQAPTLLVIKVTSEQAAGQGFILVTLPSGAQVKLAASDIDRVMSTAVATAVASASTERAAAPTDSGVPSDAAAAGTIREMCAKEWATDFEMRAYCEKKQRDGLAELRARAITSADLRTIRAGCAKDWTTDFSMRNYCEDKQV